jgi:hypothetical protein
MINVQQLSTTAIAADHIGQVVGPMHRFADLDTVAVISACDVGEWRKALHNLVWPVEMRVLSPRLQCYQLLVAVGVETDVVFQNEGRVGSAGTKRCLNKNVDTVTAGDLHITGKLRPELPSTLMR